MAGSKGKQYCAEHYEIYKQKHVLRVVGGVFIAMLAVFLLLLLAKPLMRLIRYIRPQHEYKVTALFVSEDPSWEKSSYFMRAFRDTSIGKYTPGDDHTVADIAPWFNKQFREITSQQNNVMTIGVYGLYKIDIVPPLAPEHLTASYRVINQYLKFRSYFKEVMKKNQLEEEDSDSDIVVMIDLVDRTGNPKDFMEELGFASGRYAYIRVPVKEPVWSNDYYIAAVAHYIGRCMGGELHLTEKGFPINPDGLAEPAQRPLFAQPRASLMGCYRALQEYEIDRPSTMDVYSVSLLTAYEFGWISHRKIAKLHPGR